MNNDNHDNTSCGHPSCEPTMPIAATSMNFLPKAVYATASIGPGQETTIPDITLTPRKYSRSFFRCFSPQGLSLDFE